MWVDAQISTFLRFPTLRKGEWGSESNDYCGVFMRVIL